MPTRRQQLRGAIENGLLRPGADATYADGDDASWMSVDWPGMTRRVLVEGREVNTIDTGGDTQPAPAPRYSGTANAVPAPAPLPGDDTDSILRHLGIDANEAAALREAGTVA